MATLEQNLQEMLQGAVEDLGCELWGIECQRAGRFMTVRLFIDKEGGVDLNDCTLASEKISEVMDENDPIPEMYYLDVASPGAERPIKKEKDFYNAINQPIFVSLYAPIEGDKEWLGVLKSVNDESINMEVKEKAKTKEIEIPRNKIAKARHAVMI